MPRLPKAIIAKYGISKKAWAVFRGKRASPRKVTKLAKRIRRYFPRRRRGGRRKFTIPVAVIGGAAAGLLDQNVIGNIMAGKYDRAAVWAIENYTGWDMDAKVWRPAAMQKGLLPLFIGFAVHKVCNIIGVNRELARAKVPIFRI